MPPMGGGRGIPSAEAHALMGIHLRDRRVVEVQHEGEVLLVPLCVVLYMLCHAPMESPDPVLPHRAPRRKMVVRQWRPGEDEITWIAATRA